MNPAQGQFANVVNLGAKRAEKAVKNSPFGPIQSKLVKPVTDSPAEETQLSKPEKESQPLLKDYDV